MIITEKFSQVLGHILKRLKTADKSSLQAVIEEIFKEKSKADVISLGEFAAKTGLSKEDTILLFSSLSLYAKPIVKPVTIPYVTGKAYLTLRIDGIVENPAEFEIPSEFDDEFVSPEEIKLYVAYEVCDEQF